MVVRDHQQGNEPRFTSSTLSVLDLGHRLEHVCALWNTAGSCVVPLDDDPSLGQDSGDGAASTGGDSSAAGVGGTDDRSLEQTVVGISADGSGDSDAGLLERLLQTVVSGDESLHALLPESSLRPQPSSTEPSSTEPGIGSDSSALSGPLQPRSVELTGSPTAVLAGEDETELDYEVLGDLGEGGMGTVHLARQVALGRDVALKQIRRTSRGEASVRDEFLMEAVLTGKLEHPNIVPVYELGKSPEGDLFYSMKNIVGQPWEELIDTRSLDENLVILLDVCDAVAFAHSKSVIHRDLKPQNIMVGAFGEVLVLDWGMALLVPADEDVVASPGGTPAYMAPEMVTPPYRLGRRTDVYLLGGLLFRILTGQTPHQGDSALECLKSASRNTICECNDAHLAQRDPSRELLSVALQAMSTEPADRHQSVTEFQQAVRSFESHRESLQVAETARSDLETAVTTDDYRTYARAVFGFEQSLVLWPDNQRSSEMLSEARLSYAACAEKRGDFDLALSLIDELTEKRPQVRRRLVEARDRRDARQRQVKTLKRLLVTAGMAILVLVSVTAIWINHERQIAIENERVALSNFETAERNAYNSDMLLAQQHWASGKLRILGELLSRYDDRRHLTHFEWRYWRGLLGSEQLTIGGHTDRIRRVAFSPDGQRIVSAGIDNLLKVSSAITGETIVKLEGHEGQGGCWCASFSPDGTRLVSGGVDQRVRVWDTSSGKLLHSLDGHTGFVTAVDFSRDGRKILSGSVDTTLRFWDAASGELLQTFGGHGSPVTSATFSPDGHWVASSGGQSVIKWDAKHGQKQVVMEGHTGYVTAVTFSPDSKRIVSGSVDKTVMVWDATVGEALLTLEGHAGGVWAVACAASKSQPAIIASGDDKHVVRMWDLESGKPLFTIRGHSGPVTSIDFSPDGQRIASCSADALVKVWDATTSQEADVLASGDTSVTVTVFQADGRRVICGRDDGLIEIWDVATGTRISTLAGHDRSITGLTLNTHGTRLVSSGDDRSLKVWNLDSGKLQRNLPRHTSPITGVAFHPDGRRLASSSSRTIRIFDVSTGEEVAEWRGHKRRITNVDFSPDGRHLASGSMDRTIKIWNALTGQEVTTLTGHSDSVWSVSFSPDGTQLASGSFDQTLRTWDVRAGKSLHILSGHGSFVRSVRFSPDGRRIISAGDDATIKLWDTLTGQALLTLDGHTGPVFCAVFSQDGQSLASGGQDRTLRIWRDSSLRLD